MNRFDCSPHSVLFAIGLALCGCGGSEPPPAAGGALGEAAEPGDRAGTTRASTESSAATRVAASEGTVGVSDSTGTQVAERPLLTLRSVGAARAENGHGELVSSSRAIAFDLDADRFPPRAPDPVLFVGELTFRHYEYPEPGVLRFVAHGDALLEGVTVSVGYSPGDQDRVVVMPALDLTGVR